MLALGVTLLALLASWLVAPTGAQSAAVEVGYRDFSYSTSITAPTGQKPESKLWYADGTWWGVLWNATVSPRLEIYRFNRSTQATNAWTATGTVIDIAAQRRGRRPLERQQALRADPHEGHRHLGHRPRPEVPAVRLQHHHQEVHLRGVSKTVVNKRAEAAVLDRDSTGKLWVTYTTENTSGGREVRVAHSTTSDTTWVAPYVLPAPGANNLSLDDIATLVAYRDPREARRHPQDRRAVEQRERRHRQRPVLRQPQRRAGRQHRLVGGREAVLQHAVPRRPPQHQVHRRRRQRQPLRRGQDVARTTPPRPTRPTR